MGSRGAERLFRAVLLGWVNGSPGLAGQRPGFAVRDVAFVLIVAALAWAATIVLARGMAGMTGTMGLGLGLFVPIWTLMMAAMMLPSVAPTASLYAKTFRDERWLRLAGLVAGYLAVWAAAGVPAYGLAWLGGWLTGLHPGAAHVLAVAIFAACGAYQLSSLKYRCLARCRSPLGLLLHFGSFQGRSRDLRVGVHHGAYCLACCWGLMVILIAVGVMNVLAMVGLAALVLVEKIWRAGPAVGRVAGVATLALAVATIWLPWLAPGLHSAPAPMMMN
jgi:predicted metal-binding membrane protein